MNYETVHSISAFSKSARRHLAKSTAVLLLGVIVIAGCAAKEKTTTKSPSTNSTGLTEFPLTISAANGEITIPERPERIVSMSASATEMLFAIGAGEQVTAVDSTSNYPTDAPVTDLSAFEPNVEAIAAQDPDLVVLSDDISDVVAGLEALDIPVLLEPAAANLTDVYNQLDDLGRATGNTETSVELVASMQTRITAITEMVDPDGRSVSYYHELDDTSYTVTSATFIGQIYSMLGMRNIADAADPEAGDYPQLSAEYIVAEDPDFIFLADTKCCGQSAQTVADRPGWSALSAVVNGHVIGLDDDVASRWGPRVVDLLEQVAAAIGLTEAKMVAGGDEGHVEIDTSGVPVSTP